MNCTEHQNYFLLSVLKTVLLLNSIYLCKLFRILWWRKFYRTEFWGANFNIVKVFTVSVDQFNAPLLNNRYIYTTATTKTKNKQKKNILLFCTTQQYTLFYLFVFFVLRKNGPRTNFQYKLS